MKLGSLKSASRDGELIIVNRELTHFALATLIAPTLQYAIDNWNNTKESLQQLYLEVNQRPTQFSPLRFEELAAPLPRAYQWLDGSAYLSHVERVRRSRKAEMPETIKTDPLMYQGGSDSFLGCRDPILLIDEAMGSDFEAELVVVTDDVPMQCSVKKAESHILLLGLINDVSLRYLAAKELPKGFGFLHSKPSTAFAPVFVTPDELGPAWSASQAALTLEAYRNNEWQGAPKANIGMHFNFAQLIAHAAFTRQLTAGTIIGSGTVSNADETVGYACLLEKRSEEVNKLGAAHTSFLQYGEKIRIEAFNEEGISIFGSIEQEVIPFPNSK